MNLDTLAYWILEQMETRGWTQRELARRSGVGKSTINRFVNRQGAPTVNTLRAISLALNLPLADVLAVAEVKGVDPDAYSLHVVELAAVAHSLPEEDQAYLVEIARYLCEEQTMENDDYA